MPPIRLGISVDLTRNVVDSFTLVSAPVITGNPTISGTIRTGQTLTASPASVSGSPTPTRTWQWVRAGVDIAGATAQTYTLTNLDEGRNITVRQIETNGSGSVNATSSATAVPFLLDQLSASPLLALSTRRLRAAYTGPLLRQRRSSDNTEQDATYGTDNRLNTAALLAFAGAGSGFGTIWYDQSGNGRDHPNVTLSAQPRIVNAGVVDTLNGQPAFNFNGSQGFSRVITASVVYDNPGGATFFFPQNFQNANGRPIFSEFNFSTSAQYSLRIGVGAGAGLFPEITNDAGVGPALQFVANVANNTPTVGALRDSGTFLEGFANGTRGNSGVTYSRPAAPVTMTRSRVGYNEFNEGMIGNMPEFIVLSGAVSNLDLNTIIASQGGEYGISVVPFLTPVEQLQAINGIGDGGPSFAVNFGGASDFSTPLFIDRALQCRGWTFEDDLGTTLPAPFRNSKFELASLPAGDTTAHFFFNSLETNAAGGFVGPVFPDYSGRFRFRLESGTASAVNFSNAGTGVTQIDSVTWEFDTTWSGNKWITVTPSTFPIRASLVKTTDLSKRAAGQVFRDEFLNDLPANACFRFMAWDNPNFSGHVEWTDRNQTDWQRGTFAYDYILDLIVRKNVDPWFTLPHAASDSYVTQFATWARDNIPTNRKIRVELANEIWNTGTFAATGSYFKGLAESVWGVPNGYSGPLWVEYAGKRFTQIMQIINTVFAGQTHRVIGVIGGQAAGTSLTTAMLDALSWQTYEPGTYVPPHTLAKEVTIAPYINFTNATTQGNALKTQLDISQAAAVNYVLNTMVPAGLAQAKGWIDNHVNVAASRNLRLTIYEYNQHFDLFGMSSSTLWSGGNPVPGALDALIEASYSQAMADAQDELRAYAKSRGVSLMAFFQYDGRASRFGTWGAKTHVEHNSPIWSDLLSWHVANPRWWSQ